MTPSRRSARAGLVIGILLSGLTLVPVAAVTIAQPWHVVGRSMEPSLQDGSVMLVDGLGPLVTGYGRGDIVIVPVPKEQEYADPILVKRVVAVAGDHVVIRDGEVRVNGVRLAEPYLLPGTLTLTADPLELVVPPGAVFVMGDRRENSFDSKAFGPVPASSLVGRAWLAVTPSGSLELSPVMAAGSP